MRLASATLACPADGDRTGGGARRGRGAGTARRSEDDRFPVDEVAGADGERFFTAVPVLELHPAVLDADHRPDKTRLRVLDDHADFDGQFGRAGFASSVRVVGEHVDAIAISHRVIVG